MRDFFGGWFLIPFLALGIAGGLLPRYRLLLIGAAFALLIAGLFLQEGVRKPKPRRKVKEVKARQLTLGAIQIRTGRLYVTDKWDLAQAKIALDVKPGPYEVSLSIGSLDGMEAVLRATLRSASTSEPAQSERKELPVDTGVVVFADVGSEREGLDAKRVKQVTLRMLDSAGGDEGFGVVLKDDAGQTRGVVVAAGLGDGIYPLNVLRFKDGTVEIDSVFSEA